MYRVSELWYVVRADSRRIVVVRHDFTPEQKRDGRHIGFNGLPDQS